MLPSFALRRSLRAVVVLSLGAAAACSDTTTASPDIADAALAKSSAARLNTLTVTVSGLPTGALAGITVAGSNGYSTTLNSTGTLSGLANATYTITATRVTVNGTTYGPSPASQSVSLRNGTTRSVAVGFAPVPTKGTLNVSIAGLDATPAAVTVSGPNAFVRSLTTTTSLADLEPGSYTIAASTVTSASGTIYSATPATSTVSVTAGATSAAAVTYTATGVVPSPDFNVQILAATLTQSVQTLNNSVTLIAGRAAMLRVFPVANGTNSVKPVVKVRVYNAGVLQATLDATTTGTSVPTALDQTSMARSWNVVIPGSLVRGGLAIQAEVDPDKLVAESNDGDNLFPVSGALLTPTVRAVPPLNLTFVPVQQGTATAANITASNAESYLADTRDMLPTGTVNWTIRAPYTTSATLLSDGTGWSTTLSEIRTLRSVEGSTNHYYGVVKVGYSSGVAGMGYIGLPASIGWDYLPSGNGVMAHELGHNFGRQHAPCGGPSGPDPNYPYAGGVIGAFGYNVRTNRLWQSTSPDLMTYCDPSWISDYNFNAIMNYRGTSTASLLAAGTTAEQPSLLVWGRVEANGEVVLEPAMRINALPVLPTEGGDYDVTAYDGNGAPLFSFDFTPVATADGRENDGAHFAFVVPLSESSYAQLARLEVTGNGRRAERSSRQLPAAASAAARGLDVAAEATSRARLKWNAAAFPMVMVRDPQSGEVLSFARNGDASVVSMRPDLEVIVSDGVRSAAATVRVRGR